MINKNVCRLIVKTIVRVGWESLKTVLSLIFIKYPILFQKNIQSNILKYHDPKNIQSNILNYHVPKKYSCASYKCGWVVHWNIDFLPEWKTTCLPADEMRIFEQTREHKTTQVVSFKLLHKWVLTFINRKSSHAVCFSVWGKFQRGLTRRQRGIDQQSEVSWLFERPESLIDYLRFVTWDLREPTNFVQKEDLSTSATSRHNYKITFSHFSFEQGLNNLLTKRLINLRFFATVSLSAEI